MSRRMIILRFIKGGEYDCLSFVFVDFGLGILACSIQS